MFAQFSPLTVPRMDRQNIIHFVSLPLSLTAVGSLLLSKLLRGAKVTNGSRKRLTNPPLAFSTCKSTCNPDAMDSASRSQPEVPHFVHLITTTDTNRSVYRYPCPFRSRFRVHKFAPSALPSERSPYWRTVSGITRSP